MNYERLTTRNMFGEVTVSGKDDRDVERKYQKIANRLAELEDKLESGNLVELPCKVGERVYLVYCDEVLEWSVTEIDFYRERIVFRLGHKGTSDYCAVLLKELGEYWFTTKEAAEARLKELQEGNK